MGISVRGYGLSRAPRTGVTTRTRSLRAQYWGERGRGQRPVPQMLSHWRARAGPGRGRFPINSPLPRCRLHSLFVASTISTKLDENRRIIVCHGCSTRFRNLRRARDWKPSFHAFYPSPRPRTDRHTANLRACRSGCRDGATDPSQASGPRGAQGLSQVQYSATGGPLWCRQGPHQLPSGQRRFASRSADSKRREARVLAP